jgi:uncharacterized protein
MAGWLLGLVLAMVGVAAAVRALEPRFAFFPQPDEDVTPVQLGVAYEPATITTEDDEQVRVWSLPHPNPRATVLYFHGNGGNLSVWTPVLVGVQRAGYTVHAIDYRGYGQSTGKPTERGLYRDVSAFVDAIATRVSPDVPLVYWGRSLGSTMAARAATIRRPDGVIVEAGFPDARTLLKGSPPLALLGLFSSYRFPTARFLAEAHAPVLVIHGDADGVIPFANGKALFDRLPEPRHFVVVRGGDHNDLVPRDAIAYWEAIAGFIDGLR